MKYLKKFNEELNSSTYYQAGIRLFHSGQKERGQKLIKHSEDLIIENMRKEFSKFGTFDFNVKVNNGNKFTGKFHLNIILDTMILENYDIENIYGIPFTIGAIPADDKTLDLCIRNFPEPDIGNGFFWALLMQINFNIESSGMEFTSIHLENYDETLTADFRIADRATAGKFRSLLIKMFTENTDYPSGYRNYENSYELIDKKVGAELGFTSEYGFTPDKLLKFVKSYPANRLLV